MEKQKLDIKKLIIPIAIILLIIVVIAVKINTNKEEDEDISVNEGNQFNDMESQIDITDTTNSEIRDDGIKINTSEKIAQGKEFNDVKLEDIKIESSGDMAIFSAKVDNTLGKDIEEYIIYITFLDKSGNEIDKVETLFPNIPDGELGFITATTPKDIATAYDIKIERKMK